MNKFKVKKAHSRIMASLNIKSTKYYHILEIEHQATFDDIKKAYRRKALICHPDKGGKKDQWLELLKAYETLIDPIKREIYNRFGEEGIRLASHTQAQDLNQSRNNNSAMINLPKMKNISFAIDITLEDCYFGRKLAFEIKRNRICTMCYGKGAPEENILHCIKCNGVGFVKLPQPSLQKLLSLNNYIKCDECSGEGYFYQHKCSLCNGRKVSMAKKKIEIIIEKGSNEEDKCVILNEGEEYPGFNSGDVVIVFKIKPHSTFIRHGDDLFINLSISLEKSLTGLEMPITLIDNSKITIKNNISEVIKPGMIKTVMNKGMPVKNKLNQFGNLNIKFDVEFPSKIEVSKLRQLRSWFKSKPFANKGNLTYVQYNNRRKNNEKNASNKSSIGINRNNSFNIANKKKFQFRKQLVPIVVLTDCNLMKDNNDKENK